MTPWTLLEYVDEGGLNPLQDWYGRQDVHVQTAFDLVVRILRETDDWLEPKFKKFAILQRDGAPLGEIRFRADDSTPKGKTIKKRKFRPLGLLRTDRRDFIFFGAAEKEMRGLIYTPPDAVAAAVRRYQNFVNGQGVLRAHPL